MHQQLPPPRRVSHAIVTTAALRFLVLFILTILLIQIISVVILFNLSRVMKEDPRRGFQQELQRLFPPSSMNDSGFQPIRFRARADRD